MLRPQQIQLDSLIQEIKVNPIINEIFLYWVPGAGKSLVASICSKLIKDDIKLLWIVPRDSLKEQAEYEFKNSPHFDVGNKEIRIADNSGDPFRGLCGAVTTYQTIIANPDKWVQLSKQYKLILILDEYDSLTDYSAWSEPVFTMYNNAILRIPMTGTMDRSDSVKISFVPYVNDEIDFTETAYRKWIIYDNDQALKDGSILPFETYLISGSGEYRDKKNREIRFESFDGSSNQLKCAFSTQYAFDMLNASYSHWQDYKSYYSWSKMLIVAPDIETAKTYLTWFKDKNCRAEIATSEEPENAREAIRRAKLDNSNPKAIDCLVSVAMIYKGLNIPQCSHEVFLSIVRGSAWCEQALGRIRRRYLNKETCFFFAPNDPKMIEVLKKISGGVLSIADGVPKYKKASKNHSPQQGIEAISSTAHIDTLTYSCKEKLLRESINKLINSYISEAATKIIDGQKVFVHSESLKRRKILWYKIYIKIGRQCQLKEMTYEEMTKAEELLKELK